MKTMIQNTLCALALIVGVAVQAASPALINYQGRLLDTADEPVNANVSVVVRVFTQPSGGSAVWEENVGSVLVINGLYNFQFGDAGLSDALDNDQAWLELTMGGNTFSPRQRLVSVPYALHAEIAGEVEDAPSGVPSGLIVMWYGALSAIPDGWLLCDGSNDTPDLRNRFVYGASDSVSPGTTGGANSYVLATAQLPAHTHAGASSTEGSHTHTVTTASAGAHTHTASVNSPSHRHNHYQRSYSGTYPQDSVATSPNTGTATINSGSSGNHNHTRPNVSGGSHGHTISITSNGAHEHDLTIDTTGDNEAIDNRPETMVLAFIMKE